MQQIQFHAQDCFNLVEYIVNELIVNFYFLMHVNIFGLSAIMCYLLPVVFKKIKF